MNKRRFFSILSIMLFLFSLVSVIGANASSEYNFTAVSGATGENNVFTLTSSKGYIETEVSNVDITSTYVSIKLTTITNFDIYVSGTDASGSEVVDATVVYKIATDAWNKTEYQVYGDNEFIIATAKIDSYLGETGDSTITTLTKVKFVLRGSSGDVCEILDFAITTDGVHGFDTTVSGGEEEPEVPIDPVDYVFTTDGNSTVEGNVYTLTATRSLITVDVTGMDLNLSSLYMSVKYNFSSDAEGFETKYSGVAADGSAVTNSDCAAVVAPNTTAGSPWNLTEHVVYDTCTISTIQIDNYTSTLQSLQSLTLRLKGVVGTTFELLDFALTADGVHGFSTSADSGNEEEPELPEVPAELTITTDGNASLEGDVYTLTATRALLNIDVTGRNLHAGELYVSMKYKFSSDAEGFEIRYSGVGADGTSVEGQDASAVVAPNTTVGNPWNLTEHVIYDEYVVSTVQIDNYTSLLQELNTITIRLKGVVGTTFELLDLAVTTDGVHGFSVPMSLGEPVGHSLDVTKGEAGYELSYNIDNGSWQYVSIAINNYETQYDILNLVFDANAGTNICIRLYYYENGAETYKTLRDHWGTDGLVQETGILSLSYSMEELGLKDHILSKIEIYLDNPTGTTVNTGEAVVKLVKYELINFASVIVKAQEEAIVVINEAIGSYEISNEEYVLAIQSAMTLEAIEAAKSEALEQVAAKKAEIDALNALNEAKQGSIELLEEYIIGYESEIDITSYKEQILAANKEEDVKSIFNTAKAYILEKIEEIDAANSLSKTKAEAVKELEEYKSSDLYREAEQALLASAIESGKTSILAATTETQVKEELASSKALIDALKTKSEYEAEEEALQQKALADAKENAIAELEGYKSSDLYREAEQALLASAVESGKTSINAQETIEAVDSALTEAKTTIDSIKTKAEYEAEEEAQYAQELQEAKNGAVAQLEGYKSSDLYREAEQATLAQAIQAGKEAITAATTKEAVAEALASAKTAIDGIKTKAEYEALESAKAKELADAKQKAKDDITTAIGTYEIDNASYEQAIDNAKTLEEVASALSSALDDINAKKAEIDNKPVKKGCFGSVLPSIMGIAALLGTCIVCRRKKEE